VTPYSDEHQDHAGTVNGDRRCPGHRHSEGENAIEAMETTALALALAHPDATAAAFMGVE
jgi:hypothetical protein